MPLSTKKAEALGIEAGKPINDSKGEVTRLIDTFKVAAEESVRIDGEIVNKEILTFPKVKAPGP